VDRIGGGIKSFSRTTAASKRTDHSSSQPSKTDVNVSAHTVEQSNWVPFQCKKYISPG